jgi:hypothetical protein
MPSRSWEPDPLFLEGSFITRELYAEKTGFGPKAGVGSVRELGLCTCDLQRPPGPGPRQRRASPTSLTSGITYVAGPSVDDARAASHGGAGVDSQAPARMLARSCLRVDLPFRVPGTGASAHHPRLRGSLAEWQPASVGMRGANPRACSPGGRRPGLSASAAVRRRALVAGRSILPPSGPS